MPVYCRRLSSVGLSFDTSASCFNIICFVISMYSCLLLTVCSNDFINETDDEQQQQPQQQRYRRRISVATSINHRRRYSSDFLHLPIANYTRHTTYSEVDLKSLISCHQFNKCDWQTACTVLAWGRTLKTRSQSNLAKAASNAPLAHCTRWSL